MRRAKKGVMGLIVGPLVVTVTIGGCARPTVDAGRGETSTLVSPADNGTPLSTTALPTAGPAMSRPVSVEPPTVVQSKATLTRAVLAEWPIFDDLDSMMETTTLVVVGHVAEIGPGTQQPDPPGTPVNKKGNGSIDGHVKFTVDKVLMRKGGLDPVTPITIHMSGGIANGIDERISGAARYEMGVQYVVFLRWVPERNDYTDIGGVQSFYTVGGNEMVTSFKDADLHSKVMDLIDGKSVDELKKMLSGAQG